MLSAAEFALSAVCGGQAPSSVGGDSSTFVCPSRCETALDSCAGPIQGYLDVVFAVFGTCAVDCSVLHYS